MPVKLPLFTSKIIKSFQSEFHYMYPFMPLTAKYCDGDKKKTKKKQVLCIHVSSSKSSIIWFTQFICQQWRFQQKSFQQLSKHNWNSVRCKATHNANEKQNSVKWNSCWPFKTQSQRHLTQMPSRVNKRNVIQLKTAQYMYH